MHQLAFLTFSLAAKPYFCDLQQEMEMTSCAVFPKVVHKWLRHPRQKFS